MAGDFCLERVVSAETRLLKNKFVPEPEGW